MMSRVVFCTVGSPPHMRGKVVVLDLHQLCGGITPAYAGKSAPKKWTTCGRWDHPRICGEKRLMLLVFRAVTGSPPRMRGKVSHLSIGAHLKGITPAYAGKRHERSSSRTNRRDYPRVCGEKNGICRAKVPHLGSPPRVRGKVTAILPDSLFRGITPAYAGKS